MQRMNTVQTLRQKFHCNIRTSVKRQNKHHTRETFIDTTIHKIIDAIIDNQTQTHQLISHLRQLANIIQSCSNIQNSIMSKIIQKLRTLLPAETKLCQQTIHIIALLTGFQSIKQVPNLQLIIKDIITYCFQPCMIHHTLKSITNLLTLSIDLKKLETINFGTQFTQKVCSIIQESIFSFYVCPRTMCKFLCSYIQTFPETQVINLIVEYAHYLFLDESQRFEEDYEAQYQLLHEIVQIQNIFQQEMWQKIIFQKIQSVKMLLILLQIVQNYNVTIQSFSIFQKICEAISITRLDCYASEIILQIMIRLIQNSNIGQDIVIVEKHFQEISQLLRMSRFSYSVKQFLVIMIEKTADPFLYNDILNQFSQVTSYPPQI